MMERKTGFGTVLIVFLANTSAFAGGPWMQGPTTPTHFLGRLAPVGGWNPDRPGLLHWWDPDCFVYPCTPDDYCRKPLPPLHCPPRPFRVDSPHSHLWTHGCPSCGGIH